MKLETKENTAIVVAAILSALVFIAVASLMDWLIPRWWPWIDFATATACLFGAIAYHIQEGLKQPRCLVVFLALFAAHCVVFIYLLHSGMTIRTAHYLPIIVAEGLIFGPILVYAGGLRPATDTKDSAGEN